MKICNGNKTQEQELQDQEEADIGAVRALLGGKWLAGALFGVAWISRLDRVAKPNLARHRGRQLYWRLGPHATCDPSFAALVERFSSAVSHK